MVDNIFHGGCNDFGIVRYDLMIDYLVALIGSLAVDPFPTAVIRQGPGG
jgi:hypothetical protein